MQPHGLVKTSQVGYFFLQECDGVQLVQLAMLTAYESLLLHDFI